MEFYSVIKKNELFPFATTWMELEGIILSKISQRKTNIILLTQMRTLRYKVYEHKEREAKIIYKQEGGQNIRDS